MRTRKRTNHNDKYVVFYEFGEAKTDDGEREHAAQETGDERDGRTEDDD